MEASRGGGGRLVVADGDGAQAAACESRDYGVCARTKFRGPASVMRTVASPLSSMVTKSPLASTVPVVFTAVLVVLFLAAALWRFGREEF